MSKLSPQAITLTALRSGQLQTELPEFYELKQIEENNSGHDHQNVFDHAMAVLENLTELFKLDFVTNSATHQKVADYLQRAPANLDRQTLIFLATVFHDVGKTKTTIETSPGIFVCPGHELFSAGMAKKYWPQLGLTETEQSWVDSFIRLHGYVHAFLEVNAKKGDRALFDSFQDSVGDLTIGLLLFVYADMLGSDYPKLSPVDYDKKVKALIKMLDWAVG